MSELLEKEIDFILLHDVDFSGNASVSEILRAYGFHGNNYDHGFIEQLRSAYKLDCENVSNELVNNFVIYFCILVRFIGV